MADATISQFNDFKLKRLTGTKFLVYHIVDGTVVTEVVGESDSFADFVACLPPNDCRYAVYDMAFTTTDGRPGNKLVLVAW